jgi:hypothetical protein
MGNIELKDLPGIFGLKALKTILNTHASLGEYDELP